MTETEPEKIHIKLRDDHHPSKFTETAIVRMEMDPRILELINSTQEFLTPNNAEYTEDEFRSLGYWGPYNDGPHMPRKTHIYFEGYFHAADPRKFRRQSDDEPAEDGEKLKKEEKEKDDDKNKNENNNKTTHVDIDSPILSSNPRYGHPQDKPAAPRPLRAFLFAFKKVNEKWLEELLRKLDLPFMSMDSIFADIAAQHHHGDQVSIDPFKNGGWHFDAPSSLLHLSISLHGERYLHFQHHEQATEEEKAIEDKEERRQKHIGSDGVKDVFSRVKNVPGKVYLTSPSGFMHAVEFPQCTFSNRILAVQCRTLLGSRQDYLSDRKIDWDEKTALVGEYLKSSEIQIRLPTFEEVTEALCELEKVGSVKQGDDADTKKCVIQWVVDVSKIVALYFFVTLFIFGYQFASFDFENTFFSEVCWTTLLSVSFFSNLKVTGFWYDQQSQIFSQLEV